MKEIFYLPLRPRKRTDHHEPGCDYLYDLFRKSSNWTRRSGLGSMAYCLLPPANEVRGKVICLQVCVCPQGGCLVPGGVWSQGVPGPGGAWSWGCLVPGVPDLGGCLVPGGCLVGGLVETPPDGYCCGRYASYWNAFLLCQTFHIATYVRT